MNAATWNVTVSLSEEDGHVNASAVLRAGGKVFEGCGTANSSPSDVVRPAPGAAHATERALLDLIDSIRYARLQRFAVGGFGPLRNSSSLTKSTVDNSSPNGAHATNNGAARHQNGQLAELR